MRLCAGLRGGLVGLELALKRLWNRANPRVRSLLRALSGRIAVPSIWHRLRQCRHCGIVRASHARRRQMRAAPLAPVIAEIRASGITAPYAIAAALTAQGIPTAEGAVLNRLGRLSAAGTLSSQFESQESPLSSKPNLGKPRGAKTLLSRFGIEGAHALRAA